MLEKVIELEKIVEFLENAHIKDIKKYQNPANWIEQAVIGTANSARHINALVSDLRDEFGKKGLDLEGDEPGSEWLVATVGNVLVHIFVESSRQNYTLDELWQKFEKR